jgi:hypothetical protein
MRCGKKKVWLDPNEINAIANTNSRKYFNISTPRCPVFPFILLNLGQFLDLQVFQKLIVSEEFLVGYISL